MPLFWHHVIVIIIHSLSSKRNWVLYRDYLLAIIIEWRLSNRVKNEQGNQMVRKIYYSNLDIWKFISAVFVVFLHTVNISTLHGKAEITRQWLFRITQSINPVEYFWLLRLSFFLRIWHTRRSENTSLDCWSCMRFGQYSTYQGRPLIAMKRMAVWLAQLNCFEDYSSPEHQDISGIFLPWYIAYFFFSHSSTERWSGAHG